MKKFFSIIALAFVAAMSLSFVSCSNDDDSEDDVKSNNTAVVKVTYEFSEDYLSLFSVTYSVTDFDGVTTSYPVSKAGEGSFQIQTKKTEGTASVKVDIVGRSDFKVDEAKSYELSAAGSIISAIVTPENSYAQLVQTNFPFVADSSTSAQFTAETAAQYQTKRATSKTATFTLANGKFQ